MTTIDDDSSLSTRVGSEKASIKTSKNKRNFRQGGAILAVPVCYSMVGINITLLSPSLTRIALDLGNLGGRQWIVTYMITYLATTPITGKVQYIISAYISGTSQQRIFKETFIMHMLAFGYLWKVDDIQS